MSAMTKAKRQSPAHTEYRLCGVFSLQSSVSKSQSLRVAESSSLAIGLELWRTDNESLMKCQNV